MKRARPILLVVLAAALAVTLFFLRRPLVAWFSGKTVGAGETTAPLRAGPFQISAALDPDPPTQKGNTLVLTIEDASGKPDDAATVSVVYDMPAMGSMSEMKGNARVSHEGKGRYRAAFDLPMAGSWGLDVSIRSPAGAATQSFSLTVGTKGLSPVGGSAAAAAGSAAPAPSEIDHYTCPMHPSVREEHPGKCPICGMELVPVTKQQQAEGSVMIDEARRQLIGVRTAPVVRAPMKDTLRAVGRIAYDESALADVNLRVRGWITKLYVSRTGQHVVRGQPLLRLYSPEIYNAERDFLLAARGPLAAAEAGGAGDAGTRDSFRGATRQRLRLLGLDEAAIDAVAKSGVATQDVTFTAPATGYVIEKNVVEGAAVDPGTRLFRIAALRRVWVEADIYEPDMTLVRVGQAARVTLDYVPGRKFDAKITYVYPYLDTASRTGRVRIELDNHDLELRPGMYANVELDVDLGLRVQVPVDAVIYTGPRRLVFVDLGDGRFQPKEIEVGTQTSDTFEVLSGLEPGERVAVSGVFLIAAEARIRTAAKYWEPSPAPSGSAP